MTPDSSSLNQELKLKSGAAEAQAKRVAGAIEQGSKYVSIPYFSTQGELELIPVVALCTSFLLHSWVPTLAGASTREVLYKRLPFPGHFPQALSFPPHIMFATATACYLPLILLIYTFIPS